MGKLLTVTGENKELLNAFSTRLLLSLHLMARRIVSWGAMSPSSLQILQKHIPSSPPIPSSRTHMTLLRLSRCSSCSPSRAMNTALQVIESSGTKTSTPTSTYPGADAADDSFTRHPTYFFKDGNVAFLVHVVRSCKWCDVKFID